MLLLSNHLMWLFSAINQQPLVSDSYKVSNSMLKPDLCNCVKIEVIESAAPPQQPHKHGTIFWDTLHMYIKTQPERPFRFSTSV